MDAYQQPHRYMRPPPPPPPSTADPYYHHQQQQQQQQPPPPPPVPPQQGPWYSNQFQYHPPSSHSPSPPPPPPPQQQSQWAPQQPPPPHHSDHSAYPPLPLPYPTHHHNNNHFPPPPHVPPQSYPNQEWANPNWSHHQGWDYSAHNNVEDWAARAREWAAAKAAIEDQHPQPQFTPVGRSEEQSRFHDQYPQAVNSHYPASSYQQYPAPPGPPHRPPMVYPQETASISSGPPSYAPDGHLPYGTLAGDTNAGYSHQETLPTSPYVHQQEVPSSYSSVTGKEETAEKEQMYTSLPFSISSAQDAQYHVQLPLPAVGRSVLSEQPFAYGNQAADPTTDLSDQPLDFAPRFNRDHDPHMQSGYAAHHDPAGTVRGIDPVAALPSVNSWTPPVAPGVIYPPIPPVPPSGPQHDPSLVVPPVSGHTVPPFGRFPGPSFQSTIPSAGALYGLGVGPTVHPTTAFPGDTYGVSTVSERPKKAAMPNWLKEEIIKNKAIISKSSLEHPKEETLSIEDDGVDKSIGKGDQADSKSIDSSKSTEEEDDDEDYVEAAKTAAINQEIKRVLTEVLLKVTDELFDEIATKVLSEDDLTVEVDHNIVSSNHKASTSPPAVPTSKASAKVLVPVKAKESETGGVSEKSSSSSPGDVLGLANYASDEDGDGEIQSSSMPNPRENAVPQQSSIKKLPEDMHDATENGSSQVELEEHSRAQTNLESDIARSDDINVGGKMLDADNGLGSKDTLGEKVIMKSELPGENVIVKSKWDDSQGQDTRMKLDKNDRHESKRKDFVKEVESSRKRADEKGDENRRRQDERHLRKEKTDDRNGSKERMKVNESESRRRSTHPDVKEDRKDTERLHRASGKEDTDRKRERAKDREEDRSRHKLTSDSSKHKRRRSPSISSRDRNSKDNSVSHANDSSDEASDDSKRKLHSRKRNSSPSPLRSRRRHVSRSPHSKHSQRRHSPYSSLETTRGRKSRSRSPVRRQR